MQMPTLQAWPACGSHSLPRFSLEPQTWCAPELVVTDLHTFRLGRFAHAVSFGGAQLM